MNKDKRWRLSDVGFCLTVNSTEAVKRLKNLDRYKMIANGEEAVVEVAKIAPYGVKGEYLCSVKMGVLFDLNGNCMSSGQIRLVGKTDEPVRPLAAPAVNDPIVNPPAKAARGKGENRKFNTTISPNHGSAGKATHGGVLTAEIVLRLRTVGSDGQPVESLADISRETGINSKTLSDARRFRTWKNLPEQVRLDLSEASLAYLDAHHPAPQVFVSLQANMPADGVAA